MFLLSQVVDMGKNDDLEDPESISDDSDTEVTSEVWMANGLFDTTHVFRC